MAQVLPVLFVCFVFALVVGRKEEMEDKPELSPLPAPTPQVEGEDENKNVMLQNRFCGFLDSATSAGYTPIHLVHTYSNTTLKPQSINYQRIS